MHRIRVKSIPCSEKDSFLQFCTTFGEVESFKELQVKEKAAVVEVSYFDKKDAEEAAKNMDGMVFHSLVIRATYLTV